MKYAVGVVERDATSRLSADDSGVKGADGGSAS